MAIPSNWKSKEHLPDWAVPLLELGHIVERDGVLVPEVEGMRPKTVSDGFRTQNVELKRQLEELQDSIRGGLSAAEAAEKETQIHALRDRLEAGEDDDRVADLVKKRTSTVEVDGRQITVLRTDSAALTAYLKKQAEGTAATAQTIETVNRELAVERIEGGARSAMAAIGGFKDAAQDDVVRYVRSIYRMGADHQPFMPDPDAPPPTTAGELPVALAGEDGKNLSIEDHLRAVVEGGSKTGVWIEDPSGPKRTPKPGHPKGGGDKAAGVSRISRGLAAHRAGA